MYWIYTTTFPPQTIPMSATWLRVRVNPFTQDCRFFNASLAAHWAWYSTAPPPTVPKKVPSSFTSMREPAPLGVEPELAIMVASTAPSPRSNASNNS